MNWWAPPSPTLPWFWFFFLTWSSILSRPTRLGVQANTEFAGLEAFALSPNKASLPPISVSAYDVCGTITVEGLSAIHDVVIASASDDSVVASTRSAADGYAICKRA